MKGFFCPFYYARVRLSLHCKVKNMAEYSKEIKLAFVKRLLQQHGEWLAKEFQEALAENGNVRTGALKGGIRYEVKDSNEGSEVQFKFFDYGRFFEIAGNKKNKTKWPSNENKMAWLLTGEVSAAKKKMRKKRKIQWYARNMYGGLGRLCGEISAGLSDEELAAIKAELEKAVQVNN